MSVSALRLIPCRRLSSTKPSLKKVISWKDFRKIAKVTGAVILGGCVFIKYEVVKLNQAVTVSTQAILQEKQKSFIYLTPITKVEQETLGTNLHDLTNKAKKELHKAARKLIEISSRVLQRPLDERLSHLDADPHELALWMLLKKTRSTSQPERLQAVQDLARRLWQDYQYQTVAQSVDQRTAIGLARTPNVDLRFFLPPPTLPKLEDEFLIEDGLRQLLASLPQSEVDQCVQYFTSLALRESTHSLASQRQLVLIRIWQPMLLFLLVFLPYTLLII